MKISVKGPGIMADFMKAIGATVKGRFIHIPENKGGGYITGLSFDEDLRVMIRNYYLKEDVFIEWTNEAMEAQEHVAFLMSGVLPALKKDNSLTPERPYMLICTQAVSSVISMPSNTSFGSVVIGVSRKYLRALFGAIGHPVVQGVLEAGNDFILEAGISSSIINTTGEMLGEPVPACLERQYYKLKCEELLCHIFTILMQRDAVPVSNMHMADIKAVYAIKTHLQLHLDEPPNVSGLAAMANMSEPKLRKLFRQTFGRSVFDYYQSLRMQEAARLLKDEKLMVSEVGYKLGFSNLSHFSRMFEKYIGMKPKKYSLEG